MKLLKKMDLFKNKVGRPSNETLKKRKIFCLSIATSVLIVIAFGIFTLNHFNAVNLKGASIATCVFPYNRTKCQGVKNETVKKAHTMLKSLKYYSSTIDGMFGPKTETAVKNFQKKENLTQNSNLNYETLNRLALRTSTRYYTVKYNRNGSSTTMSGAELKSGEYVQSFIYGVSENLSKTQLIKSGYTHVGYTLSTSYYRVNYQYGCLNAKCDTGAKWYSETEILRNERQGKKFYPMVYNIGQTVSKLGSKGTGQNVTLTAKYCPSGQIYDKKTSSCKSQPLKTDMTLTCPSSVAVNKEGVCKTNMSGVKITVTKTNLNSKYKSTYTTTSSDKTKVFKYTKTGTITVTAEKSGYKTVTKTIKIEKAANTTAANSSGTSSGNITSYTITKNTIVKTDASGAMPAITRSQLLEIIEEAGTSGILRTGKRKQNAKDHIDKILEIQTKYKVHALFTLAVAVQESGMGTSGCGRYNNWFSNLYSTRRLASDGKYSRCIEYKNADEGIEKFGSLISGSKYFKAGKTKPSTIGPRYCGTTCGSSWATSVTNNMNSLLKWLK